MIEPPFPSEMTLLIWDSFFVVNILLFGVISGCIVKAGPFGRTERLSFQSRSTVCCTVAKISVCNH